MDPYTWLIYSVAALGLSLSPGPKRLACSHSWRSLRMASHHQHNRRGALGFTVLIALSLFGIGALLQSTLIGLTVLKLVGGAYLIWLGIQVWRAPPIGDTLAPVLQSSRRIGSFSSGSSAQR